MGNRHSIGEEFEDYDIVIDIQSLKDAGHGWPIMVSPSALMAVKEKLKQHTDERARAIGDTQPCSRREIVVSSVGYFNKGKTFVINKTASLNLPSARELHTRGLSFVLPRDERQNWIFLDTAGTNSPVLDASDYEMIDKRSTELFLQKLVVTLSDVLIVVVNELTWSDQELIHALQDSVKGTKRKIIVVHNFRGVKDRTVLIDLWKQYIRLPHKGVSKSYYCPSSNATCDSKQVLSFVEERTESPTEHVFLAENESAAGREFNDLTFNHIRMILSQVEPTQEGTILQRLEYWATLSIKQYLKNPGNVVIRDVAADLDLVEDHRRAKLQVVRSSDWITCAAEKDEWSLDREKALEERRKQAQSLTENALATLMVEGNDDDVSLGNTGITFDGFRILLSPPGKKGAFTPQYDVVEDDYGLHVIIDLSGTEGKAAVRTEFHVGTQMGRVATDREMKIHYLEIEGERELWYNKLEISKPLNDGSCSIEPVYETVKMNLSRDFSKFENPRKAGAFKVAVPVDPNKHDTEQKPIITACSGIVQVSVAKRHQHEPAQITKRRPKSRAS
ncbi:uncharacterized protein LOC134185084 isoform X2 [Corticium candelabrum]|uniref:uncharacterized protein LOC134185084 isoform X2 n=1 Tax=Corticium candelabrum TaxID=121492 RepID=UPI002E35F732|nr:uncharacterized protein LOC134185084 isoform X2 [Corticium candelabrum]